MNAQVEYLSDDSIDAQCDQELRRLLMTCFTKPQDVVFKTQRYFREPYSHRWIIRNESGGLVAHVGVHEKSIESEGRTFQIGGICEVCVHPDYRGRGYVKSMLECVHAWLFEQHYPFAVLFGLAGIYGSSGYREAGNLFYDEGGRGWKPVKGMMREILDMPWPTGEVHLAGPKF